uniref:protein-serine/threonine phosphatase n=1 Tax=Lates calcarifer TaxID=8187 RepID=A0A4W6CRG8_LATCA
MPVLPLHFRSRCLHFLIFLSLCYFALLLTSLFLRYSLIPSFICSYISVLCLFIAVIFPFSSSHLCCSLIAPLHIKNTVLSIFLYFFTFKITSQVSALQSLHKACEVARCHNYYPGSLFLTWISYYQSRISSNQFCINEWNAMQDVESHRANSPVLFTDLPTERERTERLIKMRLREIMMQKDLENVTCKEIRTELEMQMVCNLREFKEFIDNEMIVILGQMDSPTEIFEHVYLGSEWNASNLEELQNSGVRYILNVTREIDNFFPGMFEYHNIRVYDEEATNLLEYWNDTYKFITKAKKAGAKCLVHCKMGVSRSASTVIAYAMKEYDFIWKHLYSIHILPLSPTNTTPLPLLLPLALSDNNNNPSELQTGSAFDSRGEADGSSNHSTDSINFFSAREKFLGLAQDGRTRTLSEQAQQRTPLSHEENGVTGG